MAIDEGQSQPAETCGVCHHDKAWHMKDTILHEFDPGGKLRSKRTEQPVSRVPGGDPILRLLLIRKGLLSVEELEEAEKELKVLGVSSVGSVARSSRENPADSGGISD